MALEGARRLAERVRQSANALAPLRPIDGAGIEAMDPVTAERADAFLKRFENLVVHLQDQVWRHVLIAEGKNPSELSRRDAIEYMDRLRLVPSAAETRKAIAVRNQLAHAYPLDPGLSGARLEEALATAPLLLDCVERAEAYLGSL